MDEIEFPRMMYRAPGAEDVQGHKLATRVVSYEEEMHVAQSDGWSLTVADAVAANTAPTGAAEFRLESAAVSAEAEKILAAAQEEAANEVGKIKAAAAEEAAAIVAAAKEEASGIVSAAKAESEKLAAAAPAAGKKR